jgi:hypothetical protein
VPGAIDKPAVPFGIADLEWDLKKGERRKATDISYLTDD